MKALIITLVVVAVLAVIGLGLALKIVRQYERGVLFRFGRTGSAAVPDPVPPLIPEAIETASQPA